MANKSITANVSITGDIDVSGTIKKGGSPIAIPEINPTVPSGATTIPLTGLKDGNNYYDVSVESLVSITYSELKTLRTNSQLVPGKHYRITDYNCTTTTPNTSSAGHQFDIIVVADSTNKLNENARAIQHQGDTYFSNCKLEAWQLKYRLDNDTNAFDWADYSNGKGVIYYMKDEYGNEAPYDFKNMVYSLEKRFWYGDPVNGITNNMFIRDSSLDANGYYGWRSFDGGKPYAWSNAYCFSSTEDVDSTSTLYSDTSGTAVTTNAIIHNINMTSRSVYTFSFIQNSSHADASIYYGQYCKNNIINPCRMAEGYGFKYRLNWTIFYLDDSSKEFKVLGNAIGYNNYFNLIYAQQCFGNVVGNDFQKNEIGSNFKGNLISSSFHGNNIGNYFYNNVIGSEFAVNIIGNSFSLNLVGYNFARNNVGNSCYGNSIAADLTENTIGGYFSYNMLGPKFSKNLVGGHFENNYVGPDFYNNLIAPSVSDNCYITRSYFGSSVQYISIPATSSVRKWICVKTGVAGVSTTNRVALNVDGNRIEYSASAMIYRTV